MGVLKNVGQLKDLPRQAGANEEKTLSLALYVLSWIGWKGLCSLSRELDANKETHIDENR